MGGGYGVSMAKVGGWGEGAGGGGRSAVVW